MLCTVRYEPRYRDLRLLPLTEHQLYTTRRELPHLFLARAIFSSHAVLLQVSQNRQQQLQVLYFFLMIISRY